MRPSLLLAGVLLMIATVAHAEALRLPAIFSEGMVLQRDLPIPVWGNAIPGAVVTVSLIDGGKKLAEATATAADNGAWRVQLAPVPAGGRYSLLIIADGPAKGASEMRIFTDVLAGEVWLICGQSNMIWPMNEAAEKEDAIARRHDFPLIRVALVGRRDSHAVATPQTENHGFWGPVKWEQAAWTVTRSSATDIPGSSSAVSYFFARDLTAWLGGDIPVGMIEVGAILPVESWVDDATVAATPELAHLRGKGYPSATSNAYNANIAPLAPYPIRGVIYYQGEMNAGRMNDYYHGLRALMTSWRAAWNRPDLPFLLVQLPGFIEHLNQQQHALDMGADALAAFDRKNPDHSYCYIRDAQLRLAQEDPRVGLAVTIDLGEKFNIHPPRKRPVGERLALQARHLVFGDREVVAGGPIPIRFERRGNAFIVTFEQVGGGLIPKDELAGFELQAADGAWQPANARIDGATVIVEADGLVEPAGVRYAWAGFPPVTLYNRQGYPATPFHYPPVDFAARQRAK